MPNYKYKEYLRIMRPIPDDWPLDIYGIPFVKKSKIDLSLLNTKIKLVSLSNISIKDKNANEKIVHAFKYDKELERPYNDPISKLPVLARYYAISTLDFSMHKGMKEAQIIDATFKNRWSGAFVQANGYSNVIVTVGWVDADTYDICFAGIEDGTVLMISTLGVNNNQCIQDFKNGYYEMRRRFPNSPIICVGDRLSFMEDDVHYVKYAESFGYKNLNFWQPSIFNLVNEEEVILCRQEDLKQKMGM